jgi:predicted DNA binding CopG/RHH family protein
MRCTRRVDKRSKTVKFYVSKEEVCMIKRQAKDLGLSVPAYIRMLIRQEDGV